MKLRYTSRAKRDLELAFMWYERQRTGLGFEFLDCIEAAIDSILDHPTVYRIIVLRITPYNPTAEGPYLWHSLERRYQPRIDTNGH